MCRTGGRYSSGTDGCSGLDVKGNQGRRVQKLTGRRLYSRKNKCRKLTSRKTTFQIITSRLHLYRDAQTMKKPHPVTQQSAGRQGNSHGLFLFLGGWLPKPNSALPHRRTTAVRLSLLPPIHNLCYFLSLLAFKDKHGGSAFSSQPYLTAPLTLLQQKRLNPLAS